MLDLEKLSAKDLSAMSRQAGVECGLRFYEIAQASDPSDWALQDLLREMAKEARLQTPVLPEEEGRRPFGAARRMAADGVREFIRTSLPSLSKGFGEGTLHRDIALFYAESLEEEASRFYRMLAEHAREAEARSLFTDLSDRERGKLRYLREVVLQG
jgi:hypothetical protein